ncbi:serine protease [Sphingobium sp. LB126]|uniref:S8 family serine peptidase n=1 Tax=Sphingobium sp. LB126 TaxID=1983755 RepID=UPI000C20F452|nr:S8 family serine peptidase [Sphingobium sp. LB126]PJG49270.1 serine protease [Sphingobium sp. LB126]
MNHFERERTGKDADGKEIEMRFARPWIVAGLLLSAPGAQAQLLPSPGTSLGQVGGVVPGILDRVEGTLDQAGLDRLSPARLTDRLVAARAARIGNLLRQHGDSIELDDRHEPARRGLILLTGAKARSMEALRAAGYGVDNATVEGLDLNVARLTIPKGQSLSRALKQVRSIAPEAEASADNIYVPSGPTWAQSIVTSTAALAENGPVHGRSAGLIDGGVARHPALSGPVEQQGFARGAPRASAHGTAVASLISGTGIVRGAAPGVPLLAADVYGDDPAGGGAFAIVRALGWMAARNASVVTVSLVGPDNPLLAGAIRLARDKGVRVVAAVGNDGPAAPPSYPASYPDVIAVTGIDGRGRLLPEAGRARHVDFAAPGADMNAARADGGKGPVRGTSFAAPLVAGRLFARGDLGALAAEAKPGGKALGKGIICGLCRNID